MLLLEFNLEFSKTPPESFIEKLVRAANRLSQICVGQEWTFGANRSGSIRLLEELAPKLGCQVTSVPPVLIGERVFSSTLIRSAVECGDLEVRGEIPGAAISPSWAPSPKVANWVGGWDFQPPTFERTMNCFRQTAFTLRRRFIAEANMVASSTSVFVRRSRTKQAKESWNFTFSILMSKSTAKTSRLAFLEYLRPEQKFSGVEELQAQIQRDVEKARFGYEISLKNTERGV